MNRKLAMLTVLPLSLVTILTFYPQKQISYLPTEKEVVTREQDEPSRGYWHRAREEENRRKAAEEEANLKAQQEAELVQQAQLKAQKEAERKAREAEKKAEESSNGRYTLRVQVTAYTAHEAGDTGVAYDGRPAIANHTLAVDPDVIPLGSKVYIPGCGWFLAHDTGGAVEGHIVDRRLESHAEAVQWGRRTLEVIVIPPEKPYKMNW